MGERFEARYTQAQRDALATAYEDRRVRPAARVVALAEAGELEPGLPAFRVPGGVNTVRDFARKLRQRRAGEHTSELSKLPPRDAIEQLRRRLVNVCDQVLQDIERTPAAKRDMERIRQAGRAIREAAAIPGPTDPTPPRPGHTKTPEGKRPEGETRGGPAGTLLKAHRAQGASDQAINDQGSEPPPGEAPDSNAHGDNGSAAHDHDTGNGAINDSDHAQPGEWARAQIAQQLAREEETAGSPTG